MIVRYPYLGAILDHLSSSDALDCIEYFIQEQRSARVYFLNAHCYNVSATDQAYRTAIHAADLMLPDGVGVLWGAGQLGLPHTENLNGSDFIPLLCQEMPRRRGELKIFLLGAKPGVAARAGRQLEKDYPGVRVVGVQDGYFDPANTHAVISQINGTEPDVVLVGMGVPTQELWIHRNAPDLKTGAVFAIGGLFDFLAGEVRRAPVKVRQMGLEWAWRMTMEPTRLWRRYIMGNPMFISRILAGRWSGVRLETPKTLITTQPLNYFEIDSTNYAQPLEVEKEAC